jgi:uncharacterized protein (UPF0333 family)
MTLFDNMLELNNSFLLIALIIIAVICIYLLYSNLTKSGETASLKSGINALIQQNKKRDEIINFLLERVENLEGNVTPAQILPVMTSNPVMSLNPVVSEDIDDVLSSAEQPVINTASAAEVEDILDSITNTENEGLNTDHHLEEPVNTVVTEPVSEFSELESEFDGLLITADLNVNESITTPTEEATPIVSNDLVSALLDADEESLAGDHEFDLSTVPKGKDKLNAQYTVKQLKALSRQLKLKSKGNKTELINRIHEKLN